LDFAIFYTSDKNAPKSIPTENRDTFFRHGQFRGIFKMEKWANCDGREASGSRTKIALTGLFKSALHEYGKMGKYKRIFMTVNDLNDAPRDGFRFAS
jgi:hypothetical protein